MGGEVREGCSEEGTSELGVKGSAKSRARQAGCPQSRELQCHSGKSQQLGWGGAWGRREV